MLQNMEVRLPHTRSPYGEEADHCAFRTRIDKVNAELVTLTYGTIVVQLCKDFDNDYIEVNKQLDKMGYNIGLRLIEDYLAKSNTMKRCSNFRETAEMIAKVFCPSHPHISDTERKSMISNAYGTSRWDSRSS
jgi:hypothetical protein